MAPKCRVEVLSRVPSKKAGCTLRRKHVCRVSRPGLSPGAAAGEFSENESIVRYATSRKRKRKFTHLYVRSPASAKVTSAVCD